MAELEWLRSLLIFLTVGGGGAGLFKLVRLFQRDFLGPYRKELDEVRRRVSALEAEVTRAQQSESNAWTAVAILKRVLIVNGLQVPPLPGEPGFGPLPTPATPPTPTGEPPHA